MNKISQYQIDGSYFLAKRKFALLADEPGVGKTAQAISACDIVNARKILIICPAVARVNWRREFSEWSVFSSNFKVCESFKDSITDKCIVSYDFATENFELLSKIKWDLVICDESHFIKEPEAKRTVSIYGKNGIIRNTKRLWCLSGTPAPNNASELWPMLYTFGATPLSYSDFIGTYCDSRPTFYGGVRRDKVIGTKEKSFPEIKEMLSGIMLRRMKKDVLKELGEKSFYQVSVPGTPLVDVIDLDIKKAQKEIRALEESLSYSETTDDIARVLEALGKSMSSLRRYVGLQKVKGVAELISQELSDNAYEKIVIFGIHTDVIKQLHEALKDFSPVMVTGKTPPLEKQKNIDAFQNDKKCRVFLGNIIAAGTAITLTASHNVFFAEESWVPGENSQAADRCHRRGQEMPVTVRAASLADSIDEKVTSVLIRKMKELSQIY